MNERPKILCIDFDGVLHSYSSGWKGVDTIPDPPVDGAIEWLRALIDDPRFDPQVYSSRSKERKRVTWGDALDTYAPQEAAHVRRENKLDPAGTFLSPAANVDPAPARGTFVTVAVGVLAMRRWLREHGLEEDYIKRLKFPIQKPAAFMTIDDRAFCFRGRFPGRAEIDDFLPWNKGGETEVLRE